MEELQSKLDSLQGNLHKLIEQNQTLKDENTKLKDLVGVQKENNKECTEQVHRLEEENNKLKVVSALSGNEEYRKLMKLQLNKLIKEIDLCLVELKTS